MPMPLSYLHFDRSETDDGVSVFEAMASTRAAQQGAVRAEVQQVLDWAARSFPAGPGPLEDGQDWDCHLQVQDEAGGWRTVTLTLTGSAAFAEAFVQAFGEPAGA